MVRRQDERIGLESLVHDMKRGLIMVICPVALERHLVLSSDRYGSYPKVTSATRGWVVNVRYRSHPMAVDEMSGPAEE